MPHVYKPQIIRYLDATGRRVKKETPGARKVKEKARKWWGKYRDAHGALRRVSLCPDKGASKSMLAKLEVDASMGKVGLVDRFGPHRRRPLRDHLSDYCQHLTAKEDCEEYIKPTKKKIERIIKGCGFQYIGDLKRSPIMDFLCRLREDAPPKVLDPNKEWYTAAEVAAVLGDVKPGAIGRMARRRLLACDGDGRDRRFPRQAVQVLATRHCRGMGVTTSNHYVTAIKGFTKWLFEDERTDEDPMRILKRLNAEVDVRRDRRPVSVVDFACLLNAAATNSAFLGLEGRDRVHLYVSLPPTPAFAPGNSAALRLDRSSMTVGRA